MQIEVIPYNPTREIIESLPTSKIGGRLAEWANEDDGSLYSDHLWMIEDLPEFYKGNITRLY